jgi:hypothetical protein
MFLQVALAALPAASATLTPPQNINISGFFRVFRLSGHSPKDDGRWLFIRLYSCCGADHWPAQDE